MDRPSSIRVGAVNYLNTRPLVYELAKQHPELDLQFDYPSRLAESLEAGRLDVALVPSIEFFLHPDYLVVSDACIGCRGPVLSVKLFCRRPPGEIRTLALDGGSRTSAALVQILLHDRFGVRAELTTLPIGQGLADSDADAVLLIGDRAMHSPTGSFCDVWDLGDEWIRFAQAPFVFAMWIARRGADLAALETILAAARDRGVEHLEEIAAVEAARHGLTRPECLSYLRDNLNFYLGEEERRGLAAFGRRAAALGLIPAVREPLPNDCPTSA